MASEVVDGSRLAVGVGGCSHDGRRVAAGVEQCQLRALGHIELCELVLPTVEQCQFGASVSRHTIMTCPHDSHLTLSFGDLFDSRAATRVAEDGMAAYGRGRKRFHKVDKPRYVNAKTGTYTQEPIPTTTTTV